MAITTSETTIEEARVKYLDNLYRLLQLHEQFTSKLALLNTTSHHAITKISEVRDTLESRLADSNVATAVGGGIAVVGGVLCVTPLFAVGEPLALLGLAIAGTSEVVGKSIFDTTATQAFVQSLAEYLTVSDGFRTIAREIRETAAQTKASHSDFETLTGGGVNLPSSFGFLSFPDGSEWSDRSAKKTLVKNHLDPHISIFGPLLNELQQFLPSKMPGAATVKEVIPYVETFLGGWHESTETLGKADNLRKDIAAQTAEDAHSAQLYISIIEEFAGSSALTKPLYNICKLRRAVQLGLWERPSRELVVNQAGVMLEQMDKNIGTPLLVIAGLQTMPASDVRDGRKYSTNFFLEDDITQLGSRAMTASATGWLFDMFPILNPRKPASSDTLKATEPQKLLDTPAIKRFSLRCSFTEFGDKTVRNAAVSQHHNDAYEEMPTWIHYWKWWFADGIAAGSISSTCLIRSESNSSDGKPSNGLLKHDQSSAGAGFVEFTVPCEPGKGNWHVIPMCQSHNSPAACGNGMVTKGQCWALEIPQ